MPSRDSLLSMLPLAKRPSHLSARSLLVGGLALGVLLFSSCTEVPEDGQCEKFLDHVIELEVNAGSATEQDKAAHKKQLKAKMKKDFIKQCNTKIKSSQLVCSLNAKTLQDIEKCDS